MQALRYANADSGVEIAIEKLDDVSFEEDGSALELLQTKHHLKKSGDLTDGSSICGRRCASGRRTRRPTPRSAAVPGLR